MNNRKNVSIIIVSYNTRELLYSCLWTLFENTKNIDFEVVVVDNASSDQSIEMVKRFFPRVNVIALGENIGFGRANNEGIRVAKGRNVFLLNPDTVLLNNAVKILSDYLDEHSEVAVCGGNLFTRELEGTHSYLMHLPALYSEVDQLLGERLSICRYGNNRFFNQLGQPLEVGYVSGADMMIRKSVLDEVGCFDPDFFMYFEETELTFRIREAGYRVMSVPEARIIHLEGQSFKLKESREKMFLTSRRIYLKKTLTRGMRYFLCQLVYGVNVFVHVVYHTFVRKDADRLELWKFRWRHF